MAPYTVQDVKRQQRRDSPDTPKAVRRVIDRCYQHIQYLVVNKRTKDSCWFALNPVLMGFAPTDLDQVAECLCRDLRSAGYETEMLSRCDVIIKWKDRPDPPRGQKGTRHQREDSPPAASDQWRFASSQRSESGVLAANTRLRSPKSPTL